MLAAARMGQDSPGEGSIAPSRRNTRNRLRDCQGNADCKHFVIPVS